MERNIHPYVHGHSDTEAERLHYQATRLADLLHWDTRYLPGSSVLEAACGVGGQTVILAKNSPGAQFVSVDISSESLRRAERRIREEHIENVVFQQGDIYHLPFPPASFDHIFLCFLLEHLPDPPRALKEMKNLLKAGGTITVIEGDHGSSKPACPPGD